MVEQNSANGTHSKPLALLMSCLFFNIKHKENEVLVAWKEICVVILDNNYHKTSSEGIKTVMKKNPSGVTVKPVPIQKTLTDDKALNLLCVSIVNPVEGFCMVRMAFNVLERQKQLLLGVLSDVWRTAIPLVIGKKSGDSLLKIRLKIW